MRYEAGSFRDPKGHIFYAEGRVFRAVRHAGARSFEQARTAGVLDSLVEKGLLHPFTEKSPADVVFPEGVSHVLEHPAIPFVSYPYEWGFTLHKAAALHHLNIHLAALERGFTLSDASAFNVQFIGTRPVFIDHLSIVPYVDGMIWDGHRQFCSHFLNPLLMWSYLGVPPNAWFRGAMEGIAPEDIAPMLSIRQRCSWTVFVHVIGQSALGRFTSTNGMSARQKRRSLSCNALLGILTGLRGFIDALQPPSRQTVWSDYAQHTTYDTEDADKKRLLVAEMVASVRPRLFFDIGCNAGDYAEVALGAGADNVVGFDFDFSALERACEGVGRRQARFLPLWLDAANPTPAQGWAQSERKGLQERGPADALVALALVHHLAISRNVPLHRIVPWLVGLAREGVVEFPQKSDPMVQRLLANRADIFTDYDERCFLDAIQAHAEIRKIVRLSGNQRLLVWYRKT